MEDAADGIVGHRPAGAHVHGQAPAHSHTTVDPHGHAAHAHPGTGHGAHRHGVAGLGARLAGWLRPHSHDQSSQIDPALERSAEGIRATKLSLVFLLVSAVVQLAIALVSGSVALFADLVHNVADAATSIPLWLAFVVGRRVRTSGFGYGFRRSEDLAALFIVVVIGITAVSIAWESVGRLLDPRPMERLGWVLLAGIVGIVGNELAAVVRIRTGRRIGSAALVADGFHARTDTMASFAVVVAVIGTWAGFPILDPIVGLVITALILWILKETAGQVFRRLLDGVEPHIVERLELLAAEVDGVLGVDWVRARWTGHRLLGDIAIRVSPSLTVTQGHEVARTVRVHLLEHQLELEDVQVHVHPVDPAPPGDAVPHR